MRRSRDISGGGCFQVMPKFLSSLEGVRFTECGYANGTSDNPSYEDVCTKDTGFAECVHVLYDKNVLTLEELLNQFYTIIDPVSVNRQEMIPALSIAPVFIIPIQRMPMLYSSLWTSFRNPMISRLLLNISLLKISFRVDLSSGLSG